MTAQIAERLRYDGQELSMDANPLNTYFNMGGVNPGFESHSTALWRGYVGSWDIVEGRLYLIELSGTLANGDTVSLATLFPGFPDRVFAHWYSGTIRIPQGELLQDIHAGYVDKYERDLLLEIEMGIIKHARVRQNGIARTGHEPEEHRMGDMSVFPRSDKDQGNPS